MRIRSVILAALLLLSLGLTAWAHVAVMEQKDAVALEEAVMEGDPADAAGVTVALRTECMDRLFWDITLAVGPEGRVHTGYTYSASQKQYFKEWGPRGIQFDFWGSIGATREDAAEYESGMEKPFNDVASRCPAGTEEYTERVDLSDYYADFPIYVQDVDIFPERVGIYVEDESVERQVQRELRRCFPIAVPEGTYVEIRVDKDENGELRGYGFSPPENELQPEVCSVVTERGCYFTLSSAGRDGGRVHTVFSEGGVGSTVDSPAQENAGKPDTSRFPLGYGVYLLPVDLMAEPEQTTAYGETLKSVRLGSITRVHPIDPGADFAALHANADKSLLYLLTRQGGEVTLTVLDAADGGEVDTLPLFPAAEAVETARRPVDLIVEDDFLVAYRADGRFAVVTWTGADYGTALTGSFENIYRNDWRFSEEDWLYEGLPAVDFDGERLAVADLMGNSFFLAVYGRAGPAFLASYTNSQDYDGLRHGIEPLEPRPLTVALPAARRRAGP